MNQMYLEITGQYVKPGNEEPIPTGFTAEESVTQDDQAE